MKKSKDNIEQHVMAKITEGQVKMRPKFYFVALSIVGILGLTLLSLVAAYSISLLSLWVRIQNAPGPAYGAKRNFTSLVDRFPWWALLLSGLTIVLIIFLAKRKGPFYKIRLSYLVGAAVIIILLAGFVLSYSQFPNIIKGHPHQGNGQGLMHGRQMK